MRFLQTASLMALLTFSWNARAVAEVTSQKSRLKDFISSYIKPGHQQEKLWPKKWTRELESKNVELSEFLGDECEPGTCYAAIASQVVNVPYSKIRNVLTTDGSLRLLIASVKTLKDFNFSEITELSLKVRMKIKVPVLSDYNVEEFLKAYETPTKEGILEWYQASDYGELEYNHGAVIAQADGDRTKIFVIGGYIIKKAYRLGWFARGSARSFTQTHYSSYLTALMDSLKNGPISVTTAGATSL